MSRPELTGAPFDVLVVGAGINGVGIAQDAALRGLIRRMPSAGRGRQGQTKGSIQGRRGYVRSATHRTTGK